MRLVMNLKPSHELKIKVIKCTQAYTKKNKKSQAFHQTLRRIYAVFHQTLDELRFNTWNFDMNEISWQSTWQEHIINWKLTYSKQVSPIEITLKD